MARKSNKKEIEDLVRATEQTRIRLEESWRQVEELDAAIQASQDARFERERRHPNKNAKKELRSCMIQ